MPQSRSSEPRKISFVLEEQNQPDTESIGSSKNSLVAHHVSPFLPPLYLPEHKEETRSGPRLTQGKSSLLKRASSGSSFRCGLLLLSHAWLAGAAFG